MSDALFTARLYWDGKRGVAKLHGVSVDLTGPPRLPRLPHLVEIDYAPTVRVAQWRPSAGAWADMEPADIAAAAQLLERMASGARAAFEPSP
jgi:hypothetical protein